MKKTKGTGVMLFGMFAIIVIIAVFILAGNGAKKEAASKEIRVGLLLYRGDDTFISTLRSYIEEKAKEYERTEGIKVTLDILDAKSNQNTQNNQVDRLLELGCNALCVNIVDRFAASVVIDKAMAADVPVIFFNREPVEEDMNRWEKLYYVGADAKESAVLEGKILVDAYRKDPASLDRNGDGTVTILQAAVSSSALVPKRVCIRFIYGCRWPIRWHRRRPVRYCPVLLPKQVSLVLL